MSGATIVAMTASIPNAIAVLDRESVDIGLLDINLAGLQSYDVARALIARAIPVLFLTGYEPGYLPEDLAGVPVITKPASWEDVLNELASLLRQRSEQPSQG